MKYQMRMHNLIILIFLVTFAVIYPQSALAQSLSAEQMLTNLQAQYPALWKMVTAICYVVGFIFAMSGVYQLKVYGELRTMMSTQTSMRTPITYLIVAAVLMFIPTAFGTLMVTTFGTSSPLSYNNTISSVSPVVITAIAGLVQFVGLIAFVRGWMMLVAHAKQPGGHVTIGKALTHIIGGVLAINILGLANVIWTTFGFSAPF